MASAPPWSYPLSPTARWVLARGLPTRLAPPTRRLDAVAYESLAEEAERHRITGLLIAAIADGDLLVDEASLAAAGETELDEVRRRLDYETRITEVLALLDAADIPTRILKGLAVARLEYPDEMLRLTGDLDVAVPADQIGPAVEALVVGGGHWLDPEPAPGWNRLVGKGATVTLERLSMEVDLHRILVWGPFGVRLPADALWGDARELEVGGTMRAALPREETLLHACAHQLVLGVVRAREARDVAQILHNPALDADRLLRLARHWGVEALLAVAIRLSERELALREGTSPLSDWAATFRVSHRDRLWLRAVAPPAEHRIRGVEQLAVFIELGYGRRPERWQARRVLLRANLCPAPGTYAPPLSRLATLVRRIARPSIGTRSGPGPG